MQFYQIVFYFAVLENMHIFAIGSNDDLICFHQQIHYDVAGGTQALDNTMVLKSPDKGSLEVFFASNLLYVRAPILVACSAQCDYSDLYFGNRNNHRMNILLMMIEIPKPLLCLFF